MRVCDFLGGNENFGNKGKLGLKLITYRLGGGANGGREFE